MLRALLIDESGQAMVEYGAIAGALLVSLIIAIKLVQLGLSQTMRNHHYGLSNAP
jgi:Flp pilus assembly pilin Flp